MQTLSEDTAKIISYRFKGTEVEHLLSSTKVKDWGVFSGEMVINHIDDYDNKDEKDISSMKVGDSVIVRLCDLENSHWILLTRVADDAELSYNAGVFDMFIEWLFKPFKPKQVGKVNRY